MCYHEITNSQQFIYFGKQGSLKIMISLALSSDIRSRLEELYWGMLLVVLLPLYCPRELIMLWGLVCRNYAFHQVAATVGDQKPPMYGVYNI